MTELRESPVRSEPVSSGLIECGMATTHTDIAARRRLVGEVYLAHHYIEPENQYLSQDGQYCDVYEPFSVPFLVKKSGEAVGSVRLVDASQTTIPIVRDNIEVFPEYKEFVENASFEFSQLARAKFARHWGIVPGIVRTAFDFLRERDQLEAVASIDDLALATLNGKRYNFGLKIIGPSQFYLGSNTTPVRINVNEVIDSVLRGRNHEMAEFLSGNEAKGFEWYKSL